MVRIFDYIEKTNIGFIMIGKYTVMGRTELHLGYSDQIVRYRPKFNKCPLTNYPEDSPRILARSDASFMRYFVNIQRTVDNVFHSYQTHTHVLDDNFFMKCLKNELTSICFQPITFIDKIWCTVNRCHLFMLSIILLSRDYPICENVYWTKIIDNNNSTAANAFVSSNWDVICIKPVITIRVNKLIVMTHQWNIHTNITAISLAKLLGL